MRLPPPPAAAAATRHPPPPTAALLRIAASNAVPTRAPLQWEDPTGTRRLWESAERTTRRGDIDGVAVVALIRAPSGTGPPMLPVIRQFRPPVKNYCLEVRSRLR